MRILSLVVLASCATNPDPRKLTLATMERGGLGGWIVLDATNHQQLSGELISVEPAIVRVLTLDHHLLSIARVDIVGAKLYEYDSEGGFGGWGVGGALSTATHGFFSVFSLPIWVAASSIAAASESRHMILTYPDKDWDVLGRWARFPQGLPVGVDEAALVKR